MPTDYIPDDHELMRSVAFARLELDRDQRAVGILAEAFRLRPDEEFLSANWLDFFKNTERLDRIEAAIRSARRSTRPPTRKSGFAIGRVARIKSVAQRFGYRIRVTHDPVKGCAEHVALRQFPNDCEELLELLATDHWSELILNSDFPIS